MTVLVLCVCEVCQGAIKRLRPFDSVRSSTDGLCIEPYVKQLAVACILSKLYSVSSIETFVKKNSSMRSMLTVSWTIKNSQVMKIMCLLNVRTVASADIIQTKFKQFNI